jgi:perosamine synthetase
MSLKNTIGLIPRYNWDYGFIDMLDAFTGALRAPGAGLSDVNGALGGPSLFTTSGRLSLYVILKALNLPEGAQVGVPLYCCSVVFDAIVQAGCRPRFLDITSDTYTLSPQDLERKLKGLSAIVVVHMFGHPADMDAIRAVAGSIPVIEDCAQSLFSVYKGKRTGAAGTVSFFTFRSGKYLSAGEGSAIVCNDPGLFASIKALTDALPPWGLLPSLFHHGATFIKSALYHRPWYGVVGLPLGKKLDKSLNLTAKSGFTERRIAGGDLHIVKGRLRTFDDKIRRQRENARYLLDTVARKDVVLPREKPGCESNFFQFAVRLKNQKERDRLASHLFRWGIDAGKYLDDAAEDAHSRYGYHGDCPVSEHCAKTVLTVPAYYSLSRADLEYIADRLNAFPTEPATERVAKGGTSS